MVRTKVMTVMFVDLEPVQRSEDGCDKRRFRSFNHSTCKTVLLTFNAPGSTKMMPVLVILDTPTETMTF